MSAEDEAKAAEEAAAGEAERTQAAIDKALAVAPGDADLNAGVESKVAKLTDEETSLINIGKTTQAGNHLADALKKYPEAAGETAEIQANIEKLIEQKASPDKIKERIYADTRRADSITRRVKGDVGASIVDATKNEEAEILAAQEEANKKIADNMPKPITGAGGVASKDVDLIKDAGAKVFRETGNSEAATREVVEALNKMDVKTQTQSQMAKRE